MKTLCGFIAILTGAALYAGPHPTAVEETTTVAATASTSIALVEPLFATPNFKPLNLLQEAEDAAAEAADALLEENTDEQTTFKPVPDEEDSVVVEQQASGETENLEMYQSVDNPHSGGMPMVNGDPIWLQQMMTNQACDPCATSQVFSNPCGYGSYLETYTYSTRVGCLFKRWRTRTVTVVRYYPLQVSGNAGVVHGFMEPQPNPEGLPQSDSSESPMEPTPAEPTTAGEADAFPVENADENDASESVVNPGADDNAA